MKIHVEPVEEWNREAVLALKIHESQKGFVESPGECLMEAEKERCWRPVAIYDGEQLIGFSMYGYFWQYLPFGRVWLDRLLIDCHFQGRGYGRAVMPVLLDRLHKEYRRNKVYLSVVEENKCAAHLYESFGFRFNGETDVHGEKVMVLNMRKSGRNAAAKE